jgi:hypothetical protein
MKENIFYNRVSSWIRSYRNPEALEWLRRFVDNSTEPADVKLQLYREIDYKETRLRQMPSFTCNSQGTFLADDKGAVRVYATRFSAVCKLAELALKGFEVELEQQEDSHFRIVLSAPAPVKGMNAAA